MKKIATACLAALSLVGCGSVYYTLDGQKYANKELFHQAVDANVATTLNGVQPLPRPISDKSLVFAIPSAATLVDESKNRFAKQQGNPPSGSALEILENVPLANFKNLRVFGTAIQRKNIFRSVEFVETNSMTGSIAPTSTADVLQYVEPSLGSGQWFYSSAKHGKQVFAFDRSQAGYAGKVQAFLEAVQANAVRD